MKQISSKPVRSNHHTYEPSEKRLISSVFRFVFSLSVIFGSLWARSYLTFIWITVRCAAEKDWKMGIKPNSEAQQRKFHIERKKSNQKMRWWNRKLKCIFILLAKQSKRWNQIEQPKQKQTSHRLNQSERRRRRKGKKTSSALFVPLLTFNLSFGFI